MQGLALSAQYYFTFGKPMLETMFPEYVSRIACGLVGEGSDCLGFDDELSMDHDWGAGFCIWLTDEDYDKIGLQLQEQYELLPATYNGYPKKMTGEMAQGRTGVMKTSDFYKRYTGRATGPQAINEWLRIPEHFLATATNGAVFEDHLGEFSKIRKELLRFYPEDIRLKKIVARCATMAQSGQYNYPRSINRGEFVTAQLALAEFIKATCSIVYLFNKQYAPYYKWLHKGIKNLPILDTVYDLITRLVANPMESGSRNVEIIEEICQLVIQELHRQGLSDSQDDFLNAHWPLVLQHIQTPSIRNMHVFEA